MTIGEHARELANDSRYDIQMRVRSMLLKQADQLDKYEEALRRIVNPLEYMKRDAEAEGNKLSGMAYSIANDIGYLRSIARKALGSGE